MTSDERRSSNSDRALFMAISGEREESKENLPPRKLTAKEIADQEALDKLRIEEEKQRSVTREQRRIEASIIRDTSSHRTPSMLSPEQRAKNHVKARVHNIRLMMRSKGLVNPWFSKVDDLQQLEEMCDCYNRCILFGCDMSKLDMVDNMRDLKNMAVFSSSYVSGKLVDPEKILETNKNLGGIAKLATRPEGDYIFLHEKNDKVYKMACLCLFDLYLIILTFCVFEKKWTSTHLLLTCNLYIFDF